MAPLQARLSNLVTANGNEECRKAAWNGVFFVEALVCLPRYFVIPATTFLVLVSVIASLLLIRFHTLTSEYVSCLNGIRAAFVSTEPRLLEAHVLLPRGQALARGARIDLQILFIVNVLGGLVIAYGLCHFLNRPEIGALHWRSALRWIPGIAGGVWVLVWCAVYSIACKNADRDMASRLGVEKAPRGNRWQWVRK